MTRARVEREPASAVEREPFHTRQVTCVGYCRADGLWDIEGEIVDTKSHGLDLLFDERRIEAGEPIHRMRLRLTLDDDHVIRGAEAHTDASPYAVCPEIAASYARLVGLRIGPGFGAAVRERFGGPAGCTHLTELLGPMATTAFQTIGPGRRRRDAARDGARTDPWRAHEGRLLDACHALARDGELARRHLAQGVHPGEGAASGGGEGTEDARAAVTSPGRPSSGTRPS
jgi:DUF2889 family protein